VLCLAICACGPGGRNGPGGDDNPGSDAAGPSCTDGTKRCNGSTYQTCNNGQFEDTDACSAVCDEALGCVACAPNSMTCDGGDVHTCDANGNVGGVSEACTGVNVCENGACVDACMDAATNRSYVGCEYWAADLDNAVEVLDVQGGFQCAVPGAVNATMKVCAGTGGNAGTVAGLCDAPNDACPGGFSCASTAVCILDAEHGKFAVVVSNPQARDVHVTMTGPGGQTFMSTVAAGAVGVLSPQDPANNIPDQSIDGTMKGKTGYEITSDLPIVAYQFNPLANQNVFSNDASLLIPRTAFDTTYFVLSWPTLDRRTPAPGAHDFYGYMTVIAWQDNTVIEVTPTSDVQASATQPAITKGTVTQFTLNAFETLTLEAKGPAGDLTGTKVTSVDGVQTFGVFGGHEAMDQGQASPPDADHTLGPCCADHIEEMLFPTSTWGKSFAIARSKERDQEPDLLRVIAQKDGTTVTFKPAAAGSCPTLNAGQFCQVEIAVDTEVDASEPVLIGHYLESAIWQDPLFGDAVGDGDPSLAIAVPVEQYRTDYILPVPDAYTENFLSISAPTTGQVLLDNTPVTMFAFGQHRAGRVPVTAGQHHLTCPDGCGVEVYGYSDAVSYMFAGGLDLKQIVIN
jgi:hypothetical protein